ncbi:TLD-domain-containing protein [Gigaspora margarita]|uniref:Restriction of telomere capping protein 5 n=1 Tax=Gigaspora margarita TaxID=4874 RepID=A0A8H4A527_GIGMA|nr:TLD-domain-containing protein [Gigaspora margarita]
MGQIVSGESQHVNSNGGIKNPKRSIPDKLSSELLKKNFSELESYSLKVCFDNICCVNEDGITHIDEESFVRYLNFADDINVGQLLFRSFTYLANYPNVSRSPSLLTYNGLVKAIAIYCDKIKNVIDEDYSKLLFESFATWEDDESLDKEKDTTTKLPKVKCQDLINILTAIVWVTTCEMLLPTNDESGNFLETITNLISNKNISKIRGVVTPIIYSISKPDTTYITWSKFKSFISRNAPNMFRSWSSFFYGQFFIGQTLSQSSKDSLFFGPSVRTWPALDSKSYLLNPINMAILSWMPLPDHVINRRQWNCLYTSTKHGFSMSSFSNQVFKYNGPTLMLINASVITSNGDDNIEEDDTLLLGAYISEQWNSSKPFGSEECLLFEISPTYESFPTTNYNSNYVHYSTSFGIGFGGMDTARKTSRLDKQSNSFFLQIDNTLQNGTYKNDPFKASRSAYKLSATRTSFNIDFEVLEIQVFGLGGENAKQRQDYEKKWEENLAAKRKVFRPYNTKSVDKEILKIASIIDHGYRREVDTV